MKNSGCSVPDYMLTLKKASKRTRRKLEKTVPVRDDIRIKGPSDIRKKKSNKMNGQPKDHEKSAAKPSTNDNNKKKQLANGKRKCGEIVNGAEFQKKKRKTQTQ